MNAPYFQDPDVTVLGGDCLDVLADMASSSVDAVVTDPPYALGFMGRAWDSFGSKRNEGSRGGTGDKGIIPGYGRGGTSEDRFAYRQREAREYQSWCEAWSSECLRVLKPGGHLLAFGGTRTWHRLAVAVEDAGFEIRDSIAWLYGSGFPKSLDVSKAIDKMAGAEREVIGPKVTPDGKSYTDRRPHNADSEGWDRPWKNDAEAWTAQQMQTAPATDAARQWAGWGTALKPAFEPIVVARKPIAGTVAANVVAHGTGALNIDACRVGTGEDKDDERWYSWQRGESVLQESKGMHTPGRIAPRPEQPAGRWPANLVLDGCAADELDKQSGVLTSGNLNAGHKRGSGTSSYDGGGGIIRRDYGGDSGGASRFFPTFRYTAKAATSERPSADGVAHPTVKPVDLMRWLVRLVTPPGGVVLDPFAGSGTTGEAAIHEHRRAVLIEREPEYLPLIVARLTKPMAVGFDFGD